MKMVSSNMNVISSDKKTDVTCEWFCPRFKMSRKIQPLLLHRYHHRLLALPEVCHRSKPSCNYFLNLVDAFSPCQLLESHPVGKIIPNFE